MKAVAKQKKIAHYRILELLGAGGMGAVYKAQDEKLDRVVALKLLAPEAVAHEERRRRFLQEARAASALNHPHILTIYEVGEDAGAPFIVMEYIQGETLRARISARTLPLTAALEAAAQIADALGKAHEHGIVHRDLKPENLMITRDGYAKVLDFGIAKLIGVTKQALIDSEQKTVVQVKTQAGAIIGTSGYMSPEQILGKRVDQRSDIFSLGIVLYEMTAGQRPFSGHNDIDVMHAILHETPKPAHTVNPALPADLDRILARVLAKEPKRRYQAMRDLSGEIKELKRNLELGKLPKPKTRLVLKTSTAAVRRSIKVDYEKDLNQAQFQAVTTTEGPLLVIAGAGTGKTRTLVYRVARLVETGVRPESVLLLTFTRRSAASMLARAAALADERCQRVSGGTFHSTAYSVLRKYSELADISRSFSVMDQNDTEDLIELLRRQMGFTGKDRQFPRKRTISTVFSMSVNKIQPIQEVVGREYPQYLDDTPDLQALFDKFERYKRERQLLSYDDLLVRLRDALEGGEELRQKLGTQHQYIMVDEYQDTNKLQAQIIRLLASGHDNVAVVGDEAQSIYSFRGASFRNMLEFPELFPGAQIIKLEENFRSTQPILDLANALISDASEGYKKSLFSKMKSGPAPILVSTDDEAEQSRFVAQRVEELSDEGLPFSEIAVLFRSSNHSFDLEIELARHGIPFRKFGGMKFAESAHIKDVLSFLRVVINPSDTLSWRRVLKLLDNVGDATADHIVDYLGVDKTEFRTLRSKDSLFKKLKQFPGKASYKEQLTRLAQLLSSVRETKAPGAQVGAIERFYRPILKANHDDHPRRQRELDHLVAIAKRYKTGDEFLADVALDPQDLALADAAARGKGYVTLSTVHSAKGLEWNTLFVIWMMDGRFPSLRATDVFEDLEEEKRLLYVAATRAKENLYFTCPMTTHESYGPNAFSGVSRFLEGLPPSTLTRATLSSDPDGE